jgi:hypothetical protein
MDGDKEGNYVIGCSYEEGAGFGVLWFRRDHAESEKAVEKWGNPFKKHKINWFKIGFFVSTLVCLILGAKLLVKDSAERNEVANTKWENPGLLIISVKTAMQDVSGLGMVACHRDVVELHGEEYEAVAKVIEKEFSTSGMKGELELLSYFGRAFSVSDLSCKRIDGEVISFLQEGHYSVDGVGGTIKEGYTYSVKKGVMLTMSDVLVRERSDEFYQIIDEYIVEALSKHPDVLKYNVNAEQEFQEKYGQYGKISAGWLLSEEGMVFLFREGDFGPGFVGPIEVTVPYSKLGSYIRTKYQR